MAYHKKGLTERQRGVFVESQDQVDRAKKHSEYFYDRARNTKNFESEMYWWSAVFSGTPNNKRRSHSRHRIAHHRVQEMFSRELDNHNVSFHGESGSTNREIPMSEIVVTNDKNLLSSIALANSQQSEDGYEILVHERTRPTPIHEMEAKELVGFNLLVNDIVERCENNIRILKSLAALLVELNLDTYLRKESFSNPEELFQYIEQIYTLQNKGKYNQIKYVGGSESNSKKYKVSHHHFQNTREALKTLLIKSIF